MVPNLVKIFPFLKHSIDFVFYCELFFIVVDTPGFGDAIDNTDSFQQINRYIDDQFERYLNDESGLNRKNIVDNRVHCCFYFISPHGHGMKPFDIEVRFL